MVAASTTSAPASRSASTLARWLTWLERRRWPSPWRETCTTSAPRQRPLVTSTVPKRVWTVTVAESSSPGRAYVPEPVMMPTLTRASYVPLTQQGFDLAAMHGAEAGGLGSEMDVPREQVGGRHEGEQEVGAEHEDRRPYPPGGRERREGKHPQQIPGRRPAEREGESGQHDRRCRDPVQSSADDSEGAADQ